MRNLIISDLKFSVFKGRGAFRNTFATYLLALSSFNVESHTLEQASSLEMAGVLSFKRFLNEGKVLLGRNRSSVL